MTTTSYKYAMQAKEGFAKGHYISDLRGNGHFSWQAKELEGAVLFDSAHDAEWKTAAGRDVCKSDCFVVVPVKVTTTPRTEETRTLELA